MRDGSPGQRRPPALTLTTTPRCRLPSRRRRRWVYIAGVGRRPELRPPLAVLQRHGDGRAGWADLRLWGLRRQLFPQLRGDLLARDGQVSTGLAEPVSVRAGCSRAPGGSCPARELQGLRCTLSDCLRGNQAEGEGQCAGSWGAGGRGVSDGSGVCFPHLCDSGPTCGIIGPKFFISVFEFSHVT